ncbi:DUF6508 domain-containing protein [Devosia sp. A16]|uniref:DUF6508 domain-containing protein n=1 Tax=Devosia sp. A16 TaxID=1736675 RepID=UPI0006D77F0A|nr:DUF6508 domain-containing protein [Devosia sp. A16]
MNSDYDHDKLARLAGLLPQLQVEGLGYWTEMRKDDDGAILMPEYAMSASALEFLDTCYADGWIRGDINWVEWKGTAEALTLRNDPAELDTASADQLAKLLTAIVRQDRFVEGELASAFDSGLIGRILSRAAKLAEV